MDAVPINEDCRAEGCVLRADVYVTATINLPLVGGEKEVKLAVCNEHNHALIDQTTKHISIKEN